jgi:hypothetical protein
MSMLAAIATTHRLHGCQSFIDQSSSGLLKQPPTGIPSIVLVQLVLDGICNFKNGQNEARIDWIIEGGLMLRRFWPRIYINCSEFASRTPECNRSSGTPADILL